MNIFSFPAYATSQPENWVDTIKLKYIKGLTCNVLRYSNLNLMHPIDCIDGNKIVFHVYPDHGDTPKQALEKWGYSYDPAFSPLYREPVNLDAAAKIFITFYTTDSANRPTSHSCTIAVAQGTYGILGYNYSNWYLWVGESGHNEAATNYFPSTATNCDGINFTSNSEHTSNDFYATDEN